MADITSAMNGISGFIALIFFVNNMLLEGSIFILISIFLDGLDGILARKYGVRHGKGPQIDSIADTISFCIAPATAVYSAFYLRDAPYSVLSLFTVFVSSSIVFAGIIRLGTFCDEGYALEYFSGLPTSAAALLIVFSVLSFRKDGVLYSPISGLILSMGVSILMVLRIRYPKMRGALAILSALILLYLLFSLIFQTADWNTPILQFSPALGLAMSMFYIVAGPVYCRLMDKSSRP